MNPTTIALVTLVSVGAALADAQTSPVVLDTQITRMGSPDPLVRMDAFYKVRKQHGFTESPATAGLLLRTLNRETDVTYSTLQQSHGELGVSDKYGEEFGEYLADLAEACLQFCDKNDPAVIRAFATGPFLTAQGIATELATKHASEVLPIVAENARTGTYGRQPQAVEMLGTIARVAPHLSPADARSLDEALIGAINSNSGFLPQLAIPTATAVVRDRADLEPGRRSAYHRAIVNAAANRPGAVRLAAVQGLAVFRDPADRVLLSRLAAGDSMRIESRGKTSYPVREAAQKALAAIPPM